MPIVIKILLLPFLLVRIFKRKIKKNKNNVVDMHELSDIFVTIGYLILYFPTISIIFSLNLILLPLAFMMNTLKLFYKYFSD